MRVLVGHTNQMSEIRLQHPLPGREQGADEILAFGNGYQQVVHTPGMAWEVLLANCPQGWRPDVYIHWSPEYNALPDGLEDADCLTVGVWGDWNLGGQAIRAIADSFDVQFADRNGGDLLRRAGYKNVYYSPLWAYDPDLHRRLPSPPGGRDIDILMIGNFNHGVQSERARWLARVAQLSGRYNVVLTSGIFGEEYTRLMNRAKIVFNRSIRGEMNMRAYEAPACGALLFYEAENREVRDFYADGAHCVLYNDQNLEALLDHYLAPEHASDLERVANAGWQQAQAHSNARHFADMLDQLQPLIEARGQGHMFCGPRAFSCYPPKARQTRRATQWLLSANRTIYPRIDTILKSISLSSVERDGGLDPEPVRQRAVLLAEWARALPEGPEREAKWRDALALAEQALECDPDHVLARFNLAYLYLAVGNLREAQPLLENVVARLAAPGLQNGQLQGLPFPRAYDGFLADFERTHTLYTVEAPQWRTKMQCLLSNRSHHTLAEIAYVRGAFRKAAGHTAKALTAIPDSSESLALLARALHALGSVEEAIDAYRQTLINAPFQMEAWEELARLYLDLSRPAAALALLDEWKRLLRACPLYHTLRTRCEDLQRQARELTTQTAPAPKILRLLALPDWHRADHWQSIVAAFAGAYTSADAVLLMLRAAPEEVANIQELLQALHTFLTQSLALRAATLPNITLLHQPFAPNEQWKLFHIADAVIATAPLSESLSDFVVAARLPLWSVADLAARKAA